MIHVIDKEPIDRNGIVGALRLDSLEALFYQSIRRFLAGEMHNNPSCLLLNSPSWQADESGAAEDLFSTITPFMPVIATVNNGDVAATVQFMKWGAFHVVERSVNVGILVGFLREAVEWDRARRSVRGSHQLAKDRLETLTAREKDLVQLICDGLSNKQIASKLEISAKTVANHRANLMVKIGATNTADMVRIVLSASTKLNYTRANIGKNTHI